MKGASDSRIAIFAQTNWRGTKKPFGIRQEDRLHHMYMIGKTGTGKTTLLETLIRQDMAAGQGLALLDPHGDLVGRVAASVPEHRKTDLVYFNVPDRERPLAFNPLASVPPAKQSLVASGILEAFKKLWVDSWGPRLEHILRNALLALVEQPGATLADVLRLLNDQPYRRRAAGRVSNPRVRDFWLREYEGYPARFRAEAIAPVQNKVGAFLADPVLNAVFTQRRSGFDLRQVMDESGILLVNLSKGRLGEDAAGLLGALLVSSLGAAALARADVQELERPGFFVYLDEFQSFTTPALASILWELRKYRLGLVLAHQSSCSWILDSGMRSWAMSVR